MNKFAVTGKGGAGKSTIAAALALALKKSGKAVWALDCDPDANLATIIGYPHPEKIQPVVELKDLIRERTQTKDDGPAVLYKMNPRVDDIPARYAVEHLGIRLMVMGKMKPAGSGCFCPENAFAKSLVAHLLLGEKAVLIMDMEAGIEHLTRGTAAAVDAVLVVTEPTSPGVETARRILSLAGSIGAKKTFIVANKVRNETDGEFLRENLGPQKIAYYLPYFKQLEENRGVISPQTTFIIDEMEKFISKLEV